MIYSTWSLGHCDVQSRVVACFCWRRQVLVPLAATTVLEPMAAGATERELAEEEYVRWPHRAAVPLN